MSSEQSIVDAQIQELLDVVVRRQEEECAKVNNEAQAQAKRIVKQAYRDARARLHQDILTTREDGRQELNKAEAQYQTQLRLIRQELDQNLLASTWLALNEALVRRWQQPDTRILWVEDIIRQASAKLLSNDWVIECPMDWSEADCANLKQRLIDERGEQLVFENRPSIFAGLRITAGGACVDGTLEGLLRQRVRIEELLLASINRHRQGQQL